jgi:dCMP deaminase
MRPGWRDYYLTIAQAVARRGDCTRSQVGAVVVRPDHTVAGVGYNGAPPGMPGCLTDGACPRGKISYADLPGGSSYDSGPFTCESLHAELNACANSRESLAGYLVYVTREPCAGCVRVMRAHRIERAIWPEGELVL